MNAPPSNGHLPPPAPPLTVDYVPASLGDSLLRAIFPAYAAPPQVRLPAPAADPNATPADTSPGPTLPFPTHRYTFAGEIARGGMGAVLRGRDEDLGREIAVKVMLQAHGGKAEFLQRFIEEAQIAGQLQHPGITPVYELGRFPDDRPYFAMKLVRGETLAKLLASRAASAPGAEASRVALAPGDSPRADATRLAQDRSRFLKIFEQICQTLAYAHAHGVIHRDLKPLNVMVGSFGEVQVMDWGLAKVLAHGEREAAEAAVRTKRSLGEADDISATQAGTVMGTPAYMPPEQARGEVDQLDERSDVFGLGAILCEILTGQPPYVGANHREVYDKAARGDVADALDRLEKCGADAELLLLAKRCLASEKQDRPHDASMLTQELTAYLHGVEQRLRQAELSAVEAKTKAAEETKRRQVTFRLAAGILLTLLAGLMASLWQMDRAIAAEGQATKNEEKANKLAVAEKQQREAAQNRLEQVERGSDFLAAVFDDLDTRKVEKAGKELKVVLGKRLQKAAQQLRGDVIADPLVMAKLQNALGISLLGLGHYAEAIPLLEESSQTRRAHLGADHLHTLTTLSNLGAAYEDAGHLDKALPLLEYVRDMRVKIFGVEHQSTLITLNHLGAAYLTSGQFGRAITLFQEIHKLQAQQLGTDHPDTLDALHALASAYLAAGRFDKAIPLFEKTRDVCIKQFGADHVDTLSTLAKLGEAYNAAGRFDKALPLLRKVHEAQAQKLGADHPNTLKTLSALAGALWEAGQLNQAIALFQKVRDARLQKLGADHPDTLAILADLAAAYRDAKQFDRAVQLLEEAYAAQAKKLGADHPGTLVTLTNLASAYRDIGQLQRAIMLYEQIRDIQEKKVAADHPQALATLHNLASAYHAASQLDKALPLYKQVHAAAAKKFGEDHPHTLTSLCSLAAAYRDAGRLDLALPLVEAAAKGAERRQFQLEVAGDIVRNLIDCHQRLKQFDKAESWRRKWLAVMKERTGAESPAYASELAALALNLLQQQKFADAEAALRECAAFREKKEPDVWTTFATKSALGGALLGQKKYAEAEPLLLQGYAGMKQREAKIPPQGKFRLTEALERLVQLYEAMDKWRKELAQLRNSPGAAKP